MQVPGQTLVSTERHQPDLVGQTHCIINLLVVNCGAKLNTAA